MRFLTICAAWVPLAGAILPAQLPVVERLVAEAEALGARTGVAACAAGGQVLYRHRAAEAFVPASNMKLMTAAALLRGLGTEFSFRTGFRIADGRLVVTAGGDPNWITGGPHAPAVVFGRIADELRAAGVDRIAGVAIERGTFLGPDRPATWPQDQLHTYYCAPTGAVVVEQGTFVLRLAPGADTAEVALLAPPAQRPIRGHVDMVAQKKGAVYGAIDAGDHLQVRGKMHRRSPPVEIRTAVADPQRWIEDTLVAVLAERGIQVDPAARPADRALADHRSDLKGALVRMLQDSSNFDAEQCLRVLGDRTLADGSLAGGVAALQRELTGLVGELPAGVTLIDGSGMSRGNLLTPGLLVVAMFRAAAAEGGATLRACLPVAGESGTIEERFLGTDLVGRVRAKTGWIRGASALSGMVERDGEARIWFSILMNYDPAQNGRNKDLKRLQDQLVAALEVLAEERSL